MKKPGKEQSEGKYNISIIIIIDMLKIRPLNEDVYYGAFGPIYPNDYSTFGGRTLYDVALKNLGKGSVNPEKLKEEYDKGYQTGHIKGLKKGFLAPDIAVFEGENIEPVMLTDHVSDLKKNEKLVASARGIKIAEVEEDLKSTNEYLQKATLDSINSKYKKIRQIESNEFNKKKKANPKSMNANQAAWRKIEAEINAQKQAEIDELVSQGGRRKYLTKNLQELKAGGTVGIKRTIFNNLVETPKYDSTTKTFRGTTMTITDDVAVINRESIRFMKKNNIDPLTKVLDLRTNPISKEELLGGSYTFEDLMAPPSLISKGKKIFEVQEKLNDYDEKGKDIPMFGKKIKEPKIQPVVSQIINPPTPPSTGLTTNVKSARKGKQPQRGNFTPITEFMEPRATNDESVSLNTFIETKNKNQAKNTKQSIPTNEQVLTNQPVSTNQSVLTNEQSELMTKLKEIYPGKSDDDMLDEILNKPPPKTKLTKIRKIFPNTDDKEIVRKVADLKQKMDNINTQSLGPPPVATGGPPPPPPGAGPPRGGPPPPPPPPPGGIKKVVKEVVEKVVEEKLIDKLLRKSKEELEDELNDLIKPDVVKNYWDDTSTPDKPTGQMKDEYGILINNYVNALNKKSLDVDKIHNLEGQIEKLNNILSNLKSSYSTLDLEGKFQNKETDKKITAELADLNRQLKNETNIKKYTPYIRTKNNLVRSLENEKQEKYERDEAAAKEQAKKWRAEKKSQNIHKPLQTKVNQIRVKFNKVPETPGIERRQYETEIWNLILKLNNKHPGAVELEALEKQYNDMFKTNRHVDPVKSFANMSSGERDDLILELIDKFNSESSEQTKNEYLILLKKYVDLIPAGSRGQYEKLIDNMINPLVLFKNMSPTQQKTKMDNLFKNIKAPHTEDIYYNTMNEISNLIDLLPDGLKEKYKTNYYKQNFPPNLFKEKTRKEGRAIVSEVLKKIIETPAYEKDFLNDLAAYYSKLAASRDKEKFKKQVNETLGKIVF